eukprot:2198757-Prymnesium_polylepis.3
MRAQLMTVRAVVMTMCSFLFKALWGSRSPRKSPQHTEASGVIEHADENACTAPLGSQGQPSTKGRTPLTLTPSAICAPRHTAHPSCKRPHRGSGLCGHLPFQ